MGQKPLKIESGVPVPYIRGNRGMYVNMAKKMKTGDSIFLDNVGAKSLLAAARRQGKKFISRKVDAGYRVWYVEDFEGRK